MRTTGHVHRSLPLPNADAHAVLRASLGVADGEVGAKDARASSCSIACGSLTSVLTRALTLLISLTALTACLKDDEPEPDDVGASEASTEVNDSNTTGQIFQDACCPCIDGMIQGSCEPWSEGSDCEGMVIQDCELVGNQLLCGDAC